MCALMQSPLLGACWGRHQKPSLVDAAQIDYAVYASVGTDTIALTLTAGVAQKCEWDVINTDPYGMFSAANDWFVVPMDGAYRVCSISDMAYTGSTAEVHTYINGSSARLPFVWYPAEPAGASALLVSNSLFDLNAGDTVALWVLGNSTSYWPSNSTGYTGRSEFNIERVTR